jgi:cytochrome b561
MFIIALIISTIASVALAYFAWTGIGHYKEFSEDEDKDKSSFVLRSIVLTVLLVLIAGNAIMVMKHHHKEQTANNVLEQEQKR